MLILTRRVGETLIIGDKVIHITVLGVKGCQVRLGVQAPKEVSVHREEIYLRIQAEKDSPPDEKGNLAYNGERQEISAHTLEHLHGTADGSHPSLSIQHDHLSTHPITVDVKKVPSRSHKIEK